MTDEQQPILKPVNALPYVEHKMRLRKYRIPELMATLDVFTPKQIPVPPALILKAFQDAERDDNDECESSAYNEDVQQSSTTNANDDSPMLADAVVERAPDAAVKVADASREMTTEILTAIGCDKDSGWITLDTRLKQRHKKASMLSVHERLWTERHHTLRTGENRDFVADEMAAYNSSDSTIDEQSGETKYTKENKNAGGFGIVFELLTEKELLSISEGRIYSEAEWDARVEVNAPNEAGLLDERMGPLDRSINIGGTRTVPAQCLTCAGLHHRDAHTEAKPGESGDCPGHFMHIQTPGAVYNVTLASYVRHLFASFCWHCGKLPGNLERNNAVIKEMRATCKDRFEKLVFLSGKYGKDKYCVQCTKSRRCKNCVDETQCEECARFVCFRPLVRTLRQMENDGKRQRAQFEEEHEDVDVDEDDDNDVNRRDALRRGEEYMGFPYKAFLDGNADNDSTLYRQFARSVGYVDTVNMLVLHGERVREIIQQMHCSFLQLFLESTYDTFGDVLSWFRAFVPRHIPVAPNAICPTSIGDDDTEHNLSDTRRAYRMFLRNVIKLETLLDPATKSCPSLNPCFYNTGRVPNDERTLPDKDGYFSGDNEHESPRNQWFKPDARRDIYYIEAYGEMQYYYTRIIAADMSVPFLPTHLRKRKHGGKQKSSTIEAAVGSTNGAASATNSFKERLRGKEGRFRGNMAGKRDDFTSRSVITPDPKLGIGQVGVPRATMSRFFERERVFSLNVVSLAVTGERLRNGWTRGTRRGNCTNTAAEEILYTDSRTECCLFNAANDDRLRVTSDLSGATVLGQPVYDHGYMAEAGSALERPLREGDFLIMNRQPTLHEQGMMAEEVVVTDNDAINATMDARFNRPVDTIPKTFRKAIQSTTPYNADFDGDEMNAHLPSGSLMARAEVETLMRVPEKLISTRDMSPTCGAKQDSATGIYMLTSRDTFLTYGQACQLLYSVEQTYCVSEHNRQTFKLALRLPKPAITHFERNAKGRIVKSIPLWTGVQIVSFAVPEKFNYRLGKLSSDANLDYPKLAPLKKNATANERAEYERERTKIKVGVELPLLIRDGEIMYGRFDKRSCGDKHGAITQAIIRRVLTVDVKKEKILPGDNADDKQREEAEFDEFVEMFGFISTNVTHNRSLREMHEHNSTKKWTWRHANRERSRQEACAFIDRCGWLATEYLDMVGFSVGMDDCMLPPGHLIYRKVAEINERCEREIAQVIADKRYEIMIGEVNEELARTNDPLVPWKPNRKITTGGNYSDRVSEIERVVLGIQGNSFQQIMDVVNKNLPHTNSFPPMLHSGGKGKPENAPSIIGAVGGQQLEGRRVVDRFAGPINLSQTNAASGVDRKRDANECETTAPYWLFHGARKITRQTIDTTISMRMLDNLFGRLSPHIPIGVYPSAEEGGYIDNSYVKGLNPLQMWRHAQAGREGLCDTAVKTSETGSEQRLAMKSCEDVSICYDSTVRSCTNELVSFRYGDTGYDPKKLEKKSLEIVGARVDVVRDQIMYRKTDDCLLEASKRDLVSLRVERAQIDRSIQLARTTLSAANESTRIITPGNLESTIIEVMSYFGHSIANVLLFDESAHSIRWHYTPQHDLEYISRLSTYNRDLQLFKRYSTYQEFVKYQTTKFAALGRMTEGEASRLVDASIRKWRAAGICDPITECEIRLRLCSKQITRRLELSRQCLVAILATYERTLYDAMAPPGEAVGALMVTSVGQPATQMTLNSFHLTGKSNVGVISGLPRMQEISHVTVTAKMKGLKVVIALHDGSFIFAMGQRNVIQRLLCRLLLSGPRQPALNTRAQQIEKQLVSVRRRAAETTIIAAAQNTVNMVARHSRFSDGSTPARQMAAKKVAALTLLSAIKALTGSKDDPSNVQCMLNECCVDWATQKTAAVAGLHLPPLPKDVSKPETILTAQVEKKFLLQRNTTPAMLCESIWRALMPFIGAETRHVVQEFATPTEQHHKIAIVVLGCDESARQKFYTTIRRDRMMIFVDLIGENDMPTMFQAASLTKSPPTLVTMTGEQLHESNGSILRNASARGLLRNMIATHVVDIAESFALLHQPLRYNASTQTITTVFENAPTPEVDAATLKEFESQRMQLDEELVLITEVITECSAQNDTSMLVEFEQQRTKIQAAIDKLDAQEAKHQRDTERTARRLADQMLIADESERMMCELYYSNRRAVRQMLCTRDDCVMSRVDVNDLRHAETQCGCQSDYVLVMRLDRRWFENNKMSPEQLRRSLSRELGKHFCVLIGDINSDNYIALHVRLRTCAIDEIVTELNARRFKDISNFGTLGTNEEMAEVADEETMAADAVVAAAAETTTQPSAATVTDAVDDDNEPEPEDDIDEFIEQQPTVRRISKEVLAAARAASQRRLLATDAALAILDSVVYLVLNHSICGPVRGTAVMFDEDTRQIYMPESGFESCNRTTIACNSSEFNFLLGLRGVDSENSRSNSVHDVCDVYGIEAGREAIINEYAEVLRDGSYVNRSHLSVRADVQTRHGSLAPLTADGLRANNHDVIQSATHRENTETVVDAALRSKSTYPLVSPSACVALGTPIRNIGTGIVTIVQQKILDESVYPTTPLSPQDALIMQKDYLLASIERAKQAQELDNVDPQKTKVYGTDFVPRRVIDALERGAEAVRRAWFDERVTRPGFAASLLKTTIVPLSQQPAFPNIQTPAVTTVAVAATSPILPLVINGIALDQLTKDVAAKIYDNITVSKSMLNSQPVEKLPHGFHPALLDDLGGAVPIEEDDAVCNAEFSPPHDEPADDRRKTSAATAAALATIQHDLKTMPSPTYDLQRMQQRITATKKKGVVSFADAFPNDANDDDVDDKYLPADDDEYGESAPRSPDHNDTEPGDASDKESAAGDDTDNDSTTDETASVSSSQSSSNISISSSGSSISSDRGPQVIERDVQTYKSPPFFTPPHDADVDKKTLQLAELRRQTQTVDDPSVRLDKEMAAEVASTAIPLLSRKFRHREDHARYAADLRTKQFQQPSHRHQPALPSQQQSFARTQQDYYRQQYLRDQQQQQERLRRQQQQQYQQQYQSHRQRNNAIWPQVRPQQNQSRKSKTNFDSSTSQYSHRHRAERSREQVEEYNPLQPAVTSERVTVPKQSQPTQQVEGYNPEQPAMLVAARTEKSAATEKSTPAAPTAPVVSIAHSTMLSTTQQISAAFSFLGVQLSLQQPSTSATASTSSTTVVDAVMLQQKQIEKQNVPAEFLTIYDDEDEAIFDTDFMGRSKTNNIFNN